MAIFNEAGVINRLKDWAHKYNENRKEQEKESSRKYWDEKHKAEDKAKASKKKKGLLEEQDINNAIDLVKKHFGNNAKLAKYITYYPANEIMSEYSKSDRDYASIATLYISDPDDENNKDVLIPNPDADWHNYSLEDLKKMEKDLNTLIEKIYSEMEKECDSKYGKEFEFAYSKSYYAIFIYIESKKPKKIVKED